MRAALCRGSRLPCDTARTPTATALRVTTSSSRAAARPVPQSAARSSAGCERADRGRGRVPRARLARRATYGETFTAVPAPPVRRRARAIAASRRRRNSRAEEALHELPTSLFGELEAGELSEVRCRGRGRSRVSSGEIRDFSPAPRAIAAAYPGRLLRAHLPVFTGIDPNVRIFITRSTGRLPRDTTI